MTFDEVLAKAQVVKQNLDELERIPRATIDDFNADPRNLQATMHLLQTSIQALIDIGSFYCARFGLPTPRSSHEVFVRLEESGRLPKGTADRMAPLVGVRNRLVHLYDRIDPSRVFDILTRRRSELADYLRLILAMDVD